MAHTLTITRNGRSKFFMGFPENSIDLLISDQAAVAHRIMVSAVRFTLRDEPCRHLPVVTGLALSTRPDRWGNDLLAELAYDGEALCTIAGRILEDGRVKWQVYAD